MQKLPDKFSILHREYIFSTSQTILSLSFSLESKLQHFKITALIKEETNLKKSRAA